MQRMESPEIVAQANPMSCSSQTTDSTVSAGRSIRSRRFPAVETSNAAKTGRIYRVEENQLNYFGPRSGENVAKVAALIHQ